MARFDIKDVFNRLIPGDELEGWIVVYGFGNEHNAEEVVGWLKEVSRLYPEEKGMIYICIADTSKYHKVLAPMVKKTLKKEYDKELERLNNWYSENGIEPGFKIEDRYIMVNDSGAGYFHAFGIGDQRDIPHVFIMDGDHRLRGYFKGEPEKMKELMGTLLTERRTNEFAKIHMKQRKKKMWKRYAVIGGLVWLGVEAFN